MVLYARLLSRLHLGRCHRGCPMRVCRERKSWLNTESRGVQKFSLQQGCPTALRMALRTVQNYFGSATSSGT
jgi:hypothetical protein